MGIVGAARPKMLLVGEAWGESEEAARQPFVGFAGQELWRMLGEAAPTLAPDLHQAALAQHRYGPAWIRSRQPWLEASSLALTNVFSLRPPANNLEHFCVPKKDWTDLIPSLREPWQKALAPLIRQPKSLFLHPSFLPELLRLQSEISLSRPNLIVALGATAAWALLQTTAIGSIRGAVADCNPVWAGDKVGEGGGGSPGGQASRLPAPKVLATYHPAGVLRNWSWRPIVVADLIKAFRESAYPEIRRPRREILVNPSLEEIQSWVREVILAGPAAGPLACDIETAKGQITCIGFARSATQALVIPFVSPHLASQSYWGSPREEAAAWGFVQMLLACPAPKVFQNGLYDIQYLTRMGLRIANPQEDTMLLHHSLHPEMLKGLGFLGSIYCNEASWKLMRRKKDESNKADD